MSDDGESSGLIRGHILDDLRNDTFGKRSKELLEEITDDCYDAASRGQTVYKKSLFYLKDRDLRNWIIDELARRHVDSKISRDGAYLVIFLGKFARPDDDSRSYSSDEESDNELEEEDSSSSDESSSEAKSLMIPVFLLIIMFMLIILYVKVCFFSNPTTPVICKNIANSVNSTLAKNSVAFFK